MFSCNWLIMSSVISRAIATFAVIADLNAFVADGNGWTSNQLTRAVAPMTLTTVSRVLERCVMRLCVSILPSGRFDAPRERTQTAMWAFAPRLLPGSYVVGLFVTL
jgi:hypothetical protein